jgi:hypothetical protein
MRRVVFEKCIKKSSALSHTKNGEVSLQIEFATLQPKNHDLFVKQERKRELEKQGKCGHRLIVHSLTRRGEIWGGGGVEWGDSGREGVGGSFVPTYIWAGWNGMTIHILSNSIKKRDFYLQWFESEGQQKPGDVTLMQSDCKGLHEILL